MAVMHSDDTRDHDYKELLSLPVEKIKNVGCFSFYYRHLGDGRVGPLSVYAVDKHFEYHEIWTTG